MNIYKECVIERCLQISSLYTAFEAEFDSNYFFCGEAHDFWELVYAKNGSVGVVANDSTYILSKGQLILHPPMEYHRIWSQGNEKPTVIILSFAADWNKYPEKRIFNLSEAEQVQIEQILAGIKSSFVTENRSVIMCKSGNESKAQIIVNQLEVLLLSVAATDNVPLQDVEIYNKKYAEIVNVLSRNIQNNISVDEIAQMCNMSASSLKKVFFKYSGMGIKHYFNEMKVRQATQYLHDGYSVKETAALLGFADQNYFSAFFKRIMGVAPTEYVKLG